MDLPLSTIVFRPTILSLLIPICLLFSGCLPTEAEPLKFSSQKISIKGKILTVEVAETQAQRQQGLMNRVRLPKEGGMLFVFERSQRLGFWMKNTKIPLSIGFFDKDKKLINIEKMYPPKSVLIADSELKRYFSKRLAKYALEVNLGWFERNKIKQGDSFLFLSN